MLVARPSLAAVATSGWLLQTINLQFAHVTRSTESYFSDSESPVSS